MALTRAQRVALADRARDVLRRNRRVGVSAWQGRAYDFVCPSPSRYPFQWLWDSCFHAIALCHVEPGRAARELRGVVAAAQPGGFLPHMTLWEREAHEEALAGYNIRLGGRYWTATTQPPILAQALERVHAASPDERLLDDLLPSALRWYDWWAEVRDPDGDGLVSILQPDESGLDASPKYDGLMRLLSLDPAGLRAAMGRLFAQYAPAHFDDRARLGLGLFDVEDVMVNSLYAQGLDALARLCRRHGRFADRASGLELRAVAVTRALVEHAWDSERRAFSDLAGRANAPLQVLTVTSLFPLILPRLPREIAGALVGQLTDPRTFWLPFPVPSVAASEPSFEPAYTSELIWRGPSWVNTNLLLIGGLRQHGFDAVATDLAERTLEMVARGGFREFFDPLTAAGHGAESFGWTTLVLDLLAARD